MKMQIFCRVFPPFETSKEMEDLELQINEWLKNNPGIEVKFVTHSENTEEAGHEKDHWITILVWYEEKEASHLTW